MLYIEKVTTNRTAFEKKVADIAAKLGFNPDWLMLVMWIECRLDPTRINPISKAAGLIQFMPKTLAAFGLTTAQMRAMSNLQQLDYVYKFLLPYRNKVKNYLDMYLAVFFPAAMGKALTATVEAKNLSAGLIARQNKGYDINKDGRITLQEIASVIYKQVPKSFAGTFQLLKDGVTDLVKKKVLPQV